MILSSQQQVFANKSMCGYVLHAWCIRKHGEGGAGSAADHVIFCPYAATASMDSLHLVEKSFDHYAKY